jgi:hypothetical protein
MKEKPAQISKSIVDVCLTHKGNGNLSVTSLTLPSEYVAFLSVPMRLLCRRCLLTRGLQI